MKRIALLLLMILALTTLFASMANAAPKWRRLSVGDDPAHRMTITWTDGGNSYGYVEYGPTPTLGTTEDAVVEDTSTSELGWTYSATMTGLQPDSLYHYKVCSSGVCSEMAFFLTAPTDPCTEISFGVLGDSRAQNFTTIGSWSAPKYGELLVNMMDTGVRFFINTGDLVRDGEEVDQWPDHLDNESAVSMILPAMNAIGNHDDGPGEGDGMYFNRIYTYPRNNESNTEDFYAFEYGNAIFIHMNPYSFNDSGSYESQTRFLENTLANTDKLWKFVYLHPPFYTCALEAFGWYAGHEGDEAGVAQFWEPVFDEYHVDMVFSGHNHFYELYNPVKNFGPVADPNEGTIHVTAGGAAMGDALMPGQVNFTCNNRALSSVNFHFLKLIIKGDELWMQFFDQGDRAGIGVSSVPVEHLHLVKGVDLGCLENPVDGDEDIDLDPELDPEPEVVEEEEPPVDGDDDVAPEQEEAAAEEETVVDGDEEQIPEEDTLCEPGTKRCQGTIIENCIADGSAWETYTDCAPAACEDAMCVDADGDVDAGGEGVTEEPGDKNGSSDDGCAGGLSGTALLLMGLLLGLRRRRS